MKLSAKLVTALAAIALLVVALAGVVSIQSAHAADADGTIALDKAWYTETASVKITVTDIDRDTSAATTTTSTFVNASSGLTAIGLAANIADKDNDGVIDSNDFTITETDTSLDLSALLAITVDDKIAGFVRIGKRAGVAGTETGFDADGTSELTIAYEIDTTQTLTGKVKVTSTQDSTGFTVDLTETSAASGGVFTVTITLGAASSSTTKTLKVADGDTVTAEFTDDSPTSGTSKSLKDQAKVETTGPTIDVIEPGNDLRTQQRKPKFTVQISDNESGVDTDEIKFIIDGAAGVVPDETSDVGGVITAEFTPGTNLLATDATTQLKSVDWSVTVKDIAGNSSETDSDSDVTGQQDHTIVIDRLAPNILSSGGAETGTIWDTALVADDKTNAAKDDVNSVIVVFDEDLDGATVSESDFTVDGITPISANHYTKAAASVFLTMAGAFDPDDTPKVKVVGAIGDTAGNTSSVDETTAADGIAPTFTATLSKTLTKKTVDLTITANEPITGNVPVIKITSPDPDLATTKLVSITGIKVTGTNAWEVEIDAGASADDLGDGDNAIVITGSDSAGNAATLGKTDATNDAAIVFDVDTDLAVPTFTPSGSAKTTDTSPFVQVSYAEAVTLTAATFKTGDGDEVDILAALNASSADSKLYVLSPGSYPGGASDLTLAKHTVTVSATDAADNDEKDSTVTFEIEARTDFELPLVAGWNLVSLPGQPSDPSINAVITADDVSTVITWDPAVEGNFMTAVRDSSTGRLSGSLSTIDAQHGYWINTTSFESIKVEIPLVLAPTPPPTVSVFEGWNLIPVIDVGGTAKAVPAPAEGVTGITAYLGDVEWSKVYRYSALSGKYTSITGTVEIKVGEGLWVFVTKDGTITP